MSATRERLLRRALFRGANLTLENADYVRSLRTFADELLRTDLLPRDLTVAALGIQSTAASAVVLAREPGVVAGLEELAFLLHGFGVRVRFDKKDGDFVSAGDPLLELTGDRTKLLSLERVGLNLLQRMSGIATATHCLQDRVRKHSASTWVVGTRKTPWGLLDKRALHLGGGGTHRVGLGDAILIKNNHLALIASREEEAAPVAIAAAWKFRAESAFIEVEVRGLRAAIAAARAFDGLLQKEPEEYPCLLMLDNRTPKEISEILEELRREWLWDSVLLEASGGISAANLEGYASTGIDAISIGALTHSARALDISQSIS
jgi:nicotinate-nucleotide pyrophosphorylase (carboxylating)